MKANLRWIALAAVLVTATGSARAATYIITNAPGWNLIANQLDGANGNGIRNVLTSVPLGSTVRKFNLATKSFGSTEIYTAGAGWVPGTNILNPGEGLYFSNTSASAFSLTINGNPHTPVLPLNLGSGLALVARQTNAPANITNILGYAPRNFTAVYQFLPGTGRDPSLLVSSNYNIFSLLGGVWNPGPPNNIRVGESVWVITNGAPPSVTVQNTNVSVCAGGEVVLSAAATGTPPLSFQWRRGSTIIAGATRSSYLLFPVITGVYSVVVTNMFGSTNGPALNVSAEDRVPPVLSCPSNIVTSCRGVGGVKVSYTVGISDNCDGNPTLSIVPPSGSTFFPGTNVVTATGTDAGGNSNVCTFLVIVLDNSPPQIVCPPDRSVIATTPNGARVYFSAAAFDNCDDSPVITYLPPSGSLFPLGVTPVTCIARDASGNFSTCVFNVTVAPASCCVGKSWSRPDVSSPPPRTGHGMAYDALRGKVVLFGGDNGSGLLGDTWEWDGASWSLASTNGPSPRTRVAIAYLPSVKGVVLFGGRDAKGTPLDDTWLWNGSVWTLLQVTKPPGRFSHSMATDLRREILVLFGGVSASGAELGDTWEFDGRKWGQVGGTSGGPGQRQGHAMTYASGSDQLLLYGGLKGETAFGDTWNWDGQNWKLLATSGPSPRAFTALAYNDNCNSSVLFGGGLNAGTTYADTWEWDGNKWSLTATNGPSSRYLHAMAHFSLGGKTVLVGGSRGTQGWLGETWLHGTDQTAPIVDSVDSACGDRQIVVTFNVPVSQATAEDTNHYALVCNGVVNPVLQAVLTDDPRIVWLYLSQPISSGCILLIDGVQDLCGRRIRQYTRGFECRPEPCSRGSSGTDFWLTFPGNYAPDPTNPPAPRLYIAGASGTVGAVVMPGLPTPFLTFFAIPVAGVATVNLPKEADLGSVSDLIQSNAVRVVSSKPVTVYGMNHIRFTSDAYLGLSTRALGQTYLVLGYGNEFGSLPEVNGSQFAIAATRDNTKVFVVPSDTVGTRPAGVPYSLTLMRGQTYQLRSTNDAPADLSGSIIVADQPIAVFGSHQCAAIPSSNVFFFNHVVEQLPPTELWGSSFLTVPLQTRLQGDTFRVMGLYPGTTVRTNGVAIPGLLNPGKFFEFRLATASQITSTRDVLVAQYANSSDFDLVSNSDPFMVTLPPVNFYSANYVFQVPLTDFGGNYINLTVPNASIGQIQLDGVGLAAGIFTAIPGSGYSSARVAVGTGSHRIFSLNGQAFGLIVYGWNLYDAYGYPAGLCGFVHGETGGFTCPPKTYQQAVGAGCLAAVPDFTAMVGNGNNAFFLSQQPPAGTLVGPGNYDVVVVIMDQFGKQTTCLTSLQVFAGEGSGLQCPKSFTTNCASSKGQYVNYAVGICNTNYTLVCTPPPGSLFPPGTTTVICKATTASGLTDECRFNVTVNCVTLGTVQTRTNILIYWNGGEGVLQKASGLTGPWITISNAPNPYPASPSGVQGYFRLVQ
jgi:hypothetical protein